LQLLYQDAHYIAVNKPSGLLVHRSAIDRHETRFALQEVRNLIGRRVYPVHRLDKPTSGVLLFALDPEAARRLTESFTGHTVEKTYLAVVRGYPAPEGVIDYALKEVRDRKTDRRARPDKPPQPAVTAYRRLATVELPFAVTRYPTSRYALIEARPRTGRMHQVRRHMKHIFHPIVGDGKHGEARHNRFFEAQYSCRRLLLAATEVTFPHPYTGEVLTVTAPLDDAFQSVLEQLDWLSAVPVAWLQRSAS